MQEIERKFLVRKLPKNLAEYRRTEINQGYLAYEKGWAEVRLRKAGDHHCLTIKKRSTEGRLEHNLPLDAERWAELWPLTAGRRLHKIRFDVPHGKLVIEVDLFQGLNDGLVLAEVEFPNTQSARAFDPPSWLGEEVTGDPTFSNRLRAVE